MWKCQKQCESPYMYIIEHEGEPSECVKSCPEDYYVQINTDKRYCLEKCPASDGMRYYHRENGVKICMESC